ncbi:tRNA-dihydrouridine synthase, partial [Patescibacteria group bacterium]|nr:tRNA-dihydrouridine synthase [Patescibacteria group bacterium]
LPFQALMLHGRTYEGGFGGPVDFALAQKIKKIVPEKIVLLNGGIIDPRQALDILTKYPEIDGLSIGRGTLGRPWIFDEIKSFSKTEAKLRGTSPKLSFCDARKIILEHSKLIYKDKPQAGAFEIRKHLAWYVRGFPGASEMRKKLVQTKSLEEIKKVLTEIKKGGGRQS